MNKITIYLCICENSRLEFPRLGFVLQFSVNVFVQTNRLGNLFNEMLLPLIDENRKHDYYLYLYFLGMYLYHFYIQPNKNKR